MSRLDFPASAKALWDIYDAGGPRPEYLIPVLAKESGLWHNATNGVTYGLNQVSAAWLQKRGIDPESYLTWPASRQLASIVKGYMLIHVAQFGAIGSGVKCYLMNFWPAMVRDGKTALSDVIVHRGQAAYDDNRGLDVNGDGAITVGDLAFVVYEKFHGKEYGAIVQDTIAQVYDARPTETVHDPVYGDDYPVPYLTGSYGDVAAGVQEVLAAGLTRLLGKK